MFYLATLLQKEHLVGHIPSVLYARVMTQLLLSAMTEQGVSKKHFEITQSRKQLCKLL